MQLQLEHKISCIAETSKERHFCLIKSFLIKIIIVYKRSLCTFYPSFLQVGIPYPNSKDVQVWSFLWIDQINAYSSIYLARLDVLNNREKCRLDIFLLWRWSISRSTTTCTGYPADFCRGQSGMTSRLSGHWTRPWGGASDTGECSSWLIKLTN